MKLLKLTLKNFKGIRDFTLEANGSVVSILADNGVGKTTLFDAFTWLLFNKDSTDRADFEVKTLDCSNNPIHNLEHEVTAIVELAGKNVELRKVYREKWTKKRGQAESEFTGHETEYFVDEVPRKKKEYEDFISSIAPEKIFKLVTNPLYFNSVLHWKERREIFLNMCGDVTTDEVFEANGDIGYIRELLDNKTTDDALKMLASKKKKINDELKEIPTRISEVSNMLPELPQNVDFEGLEIKKLHTLSEITEYENQLEYLQENIEKDKDVSYKLINQKQKELLDLNNKKSELEMKQKQHDNLRLSAMDLIESKRQRIAGNLRNIEQFKESITTLDAKREDLLSKYYAIEGSKFEITPDSESCKHCGQKLPAELKGQKIVALEIKFMEEKQKELQYIKSQGDSINSQKELFNKSIDNHLEINTTLESEINEIDVVSSTELSTGEISRLSTEIDKLSTEIAQLKTQVESINYGDCTKGHKDKLEVLKQDLESVNKTLSLKEVYENSQKRIGELELQEKHLSSVFVQLEKQIFGVEQFIMARVSLLEGKLNSMFDGVKFKLFQQNINGGIQEAFETLIEGVPYSDANGAAKINSGIEIINQLCRFYAISAPIWVDSCESVTRLQEADSQIIKLIVSEGDKELRVVNDL